MEIKYGKFTYETILFLSTHEQFYPVDTLKPGKFSYQLNIAHCIFPLDKFPE